ncbi:MAG TPA: TRAP transporter substrate-binding protein DctP [Stellaceae bacterium]|nr:TRAP transporter substrate-binding protein DctP [Stellaceae bacterium]
MPFSVSRRAMPALAAVVCLVLGGVGPQPARAAAVWDMYVTNAVATTIAAKGEVAMIERIEKATNGELKIKFHLAGSLPINVTNITSAVADGVVQLGDDGFFQGNIPIGGLLRLPLLIQSRAEFDKALKIAEPYITKAFAKKGVLVLGEFTYPPQVAFSRRKLATLADIKGQKLRVTSPEQGEFVRRFGGISVTLGPAEVPAALDRGVIEGVFTAASGAGYTWRDLIKYNYKLGLNYFDAYIIVNKDAFDKLSPATQKTLRDIVAKTVPNFTGQMQRQDDDLTEKMVKENGMVLTQPKPEEIAEATKAMAPFWESWAKAHGKDAVEALGKIRAALGR